MSAALTLEELAMLAENKPPLSCRFGFHKGAQVDLLITTGHWACLKCGQVFMTSLFGEFDMTRQESARWLRSRARANASCRPGNWQAQGQAPA